MTNKLHKNVHLFRGTKLTRTITAKCHFIYRCIFHRHGLKIISQSSRSADIHMMLKSWRFLLIKYLIKIQVKNLTEIKVVKLWARPESKRVQPTFLYTAMQKNKS